MSEFQAQKQSASKNASLHGSQLKDKSSKLSQSIQSKNNSNASKIHQQNQKNTTNEPKLWQAIYLDKKFYLADEQNIVKLKQLEKQIQQEKQKLQGMASKIPQKSEKSFISQRGIINKQFSERSYIHNPQLLEQRKIKAVIQLENQEAKYKKKIEEYRNSRKSRSSKQPPSQQVHTQVKEIKSNFKDSKKQKIQENQSKNKSKFEYSNRQEKSIKPQQIKTFEKQSQRQNSKKNNIETSEHKNNQIQQNTHEQNASIKKSAINSKHTQNSRKQRKSEIEKNSNKQQNSQHHQHQIPIEDQSKIQPSSQKNYSKHSKQQSNHSEIKDEDSSVKNSQSNKSSQQNSNPSHQSNTVKSKSRTSQQPSEQSQGSHKNSFKVNVNQKKLKDQSVQWSQKSDYQFYTQSNANSRMNSVPNTAFKKNKQNLAGQSQLNSIQPSSRYREIGQQRESIALPIKVHQYKVGQNNESQYQKASQSISNSKVSDKKSNKSNRAFLIHYPKQKSRSLASSKKNQSLKPTNNQKQIKNEHSERRSVDDRSKKSKSIINEQMLKKKIEQTSQMVPKSQIEQLRRQMQQLKRQLRQVKQNQSRISVKTDSIKKQEMKFQDAEQQIIQKNQNLDLVFPKISSIKQKKVFNITNSLQFNLIEQREKIAQQQEQKMDKNRLQAEIQNLKKTIRELRVQKIKYTSFASLNASQNQLNFSQNQLNISHNQLNHSRNAFTLNNTLPINQNILPQEGINLIKIEDNTHKRLQTYDDNLAEHRGQGSRVIEKMEQPNNLTTLQLDRDRQRSSINDSGIRSVIITGKIIKNIQSPEKNRTVDSIPQPKTRSMRLIFNTQRKRTPIQIPSVDFKDEENEPLPSPGKRKAQSVHHYQQKPSPHQSARKNIINKLNANEKNFQQFVENSHVMDHNAESHKIQHSLLGKTKLSRYSSDRQSPLNPQFASRNSSNDLIQPLKFQDRSSPVLQKQSRIDRPSTQMKRSFADSSLSRSNSKAKNAYLNRLQQESLDPQMDLQLQRQIPQLSFSGLAKPNLPESPHQDSTQQQLIALAKSTYKIFGVDLDDEEQDIDSNIDKSLILKKYKNCVLFSTAASNDAILWDYSGRFYFGGWKKNMEGDGQKSGEGLQFVPGKHVYKGQFLKGKKNGFGIMKMDNGNIYQGQWLDGVKSGRGKYVQANSGVTYNGQWKDNKKDGTGLLRFNANQYYDGTFSRSMKHGFGIQKFANGDIYRGQYKQGKFHGKGKYMWSNGSCYEGQFVQGLRCGQGIWRSLRDKGDKYIGQYKNDKKNGYGRYVWVNGCVYQGYFQDDLKHGKGRLVYEDGKQVKGTWVAGCLQTTQDGRKPFENQQQPLRRSIKYSSFMLQQGAKGLQKSKRNRHPI